MKKMQAIGAPFEIQYSSNSNLTPKHFEWTAEDFPVKVFIDGGISSGMMYQKKPGERKIAWVCESRAIFHLMNFPRDVWEENFIRICDSFDLVFTSEKEWVGKHPNVRYCPAGSNLPWIKNQDIFPKIKLASMIASPKKFAFGHALRHHLAEQYKDVFDLYGGVCGSRRLNPGIPWGDKSEGLNDYMFSITVENDKYSTYYTEKITDCFANGTIPIYYGTEKISDYFNTDGIIFLNDNFNLSDISVNLFQSKLTAIMDNFYKVRKMRGSDDYLMDRIKEVI
jgi:hypothetical protein